jgi:glycosyltransferase involved in cell wall biosynthesis
MTGCPQVSVVIPTFNGGRRLPSVFQALVEQTASDGSFELVVVDNASTDDTSKIAREHPVIEKLRLRDVRCKTTREERQGVLYARLHGIYAAASALVCFLDDDNIPASDYLKNGLSAFVDPSIGLLISSVRPKWEVTPPYSIARRGHLMAINNYLGSQPLDFGAVPTLAPTITAGMWLRRSAFLSAVSNIDTKKMFVGRKGKNLSSGEDLEFGILIGAVGYKRIYVPSLQIEHAIPVSRLTTGYVCRLISGVVRSELALREKYCGNVYGFCARLKAILRLLVSALALPALPIFRKDCLREAVFIMTDRWARFMGPIRN